MEADLARVLRLRRELAEQGDALPETREAMVQAGAEYKALVVKPILEASVVPPASAQPVPGFKPIRSPS
eukprot:8627200-Pyramimonas_sp.AAC.1